MPGRAHRFTRVSTMIALTATTSAQPMGCGDATGNVADVGGSGSTCAAADSTTTASPESASSTDASPTSGDATSGSDSSGSSEAGDPSSSDTSGSSGDPSSSSTGDPEPFCGDGLVQEPEECDEGTRNGALFGDCSDRCTALYPVTQVVAGHAHTCALFSSGGVRCWGSGSGGRLGYGNTEAIGDDETPDTVDDVDVGGVVVQLASGWAHTCAVLASGSLRCWGENNWGQLGYGNATTIGDDETPAAAGDVGVEGVVVQVVTGAAHTCVRLDSGAVRCWGSSPHGQLGYGDTTNHYDAGSVGEVDVGGQVAALAAGGSHTCALLETGSVRCWGAGLWGQLGYGNTENVGDDEVPAAVGDVDLGGGVMQIAAGFGHTCAVTANLGIRCWGRAADGQLGYGGTDHVGDDETPSAVAEIMLSATIPTVVTGHHHTCAIVNDGFARCWGGGIYGPLGYASTDSELSAAEVADVDVGGVIVQLTAGYSHTCALLDGGDVRCWGLGSVGQLGYGNTENIGDDELPADVGIVPLQ